MLGLPKGQLWVVDHDPAWSAMFGRERALIVASAPVGVRLQVEHIGSTSVPGLCAKPVIDVAIAIAHYEDGEALVAPLEALGYCHRGEYGIPQRRYFVKGEPRIFHIHMFANGNQNLLDMLAFRDALRANIELRRNYAFLKRDLLSRVAGEKSLYQMQKAQFITDAVRSVITSSDSVEGS